MSGTLNGDLRKNGCKLSTISKITFPRFAPADAKLVKVTDEIWSSRDSLANVKPKDDKYLSASCGY